MKKLKNLGLQFRGELHEIHLVNFSVDAAELQDRIPEPIHPIVQQGRVLISMVDVHLRNMRIGKESRQLHNRNGILSAAFSWLLTPFTFHYQHIGFRVLVDDAGWNPEHTHKGIYFLESFTDRPRIARAERLISNYRLQKAQLFNFPGGLRMKTDHGDLEYFLAGPILEPDEKLKALQAKIGAIDRAWAVDGDELRKTQIVREKWPLQPMNCIRFSTNLFASARLEGVFRVPETIHYTWLPPETVLHLSRQAHAPSLAMSYV